jgi:hypothetical protein
MHQLVGETPTANFAVIGRVALAANQCSDAILDTCCHVVVCYAVIGRVAPTANQ